MNDVQHADGWRQRVYKENRRAEELRTTLQERDLALYGPPRLTLAKAGPRRVVHQHAHPCSPLHSHGTNAARTVFNCSICGAYNAAVSPENSPNSVLQPPDSAPHSPYSAPLGPAHECTTLQRPSASELMSPSAMVETPRTLRGSTRFTPDGSPAEPSARKVKTSIKKLNLALLDEKRSKVDKLLATTGMLSPTRRAPELCASSTPPKEAEAYYHLWKGEPIRPHSHRTRYADPKTVYDASAASTHDRPASSASYRSRPTTASPVSSPSATSWAPQRGGLPHSPTSAHAKKPREPRRSRDLSPNRSAYRMNGQKEALGGVTAQWTANLRAPSEAPASPFKSPKAMPIAGPWIPNPIPSPRKK